MVLESGYTKTRDDEEATPLSTEKCSICSEKVVQQNKGKHWSEHRFPTLRQTISFLSTLLAGCVLTIIVIRFLPRQQSNTRYVNLTTTTSGAEPNTGLPQSWYNGTCGTTAQTALAHGCHFSTAMHAWLPKSCLTDEDAADDEEMYGTNVFPFSDYDTRQPLTTEEANSGTRHKALTNMEFHLVHCAYVFRRLHRALTQDGPLDSFTADYQHTTHCADMIAMAMRGETETMRTSTLLTKFPTCL